MTEARPERVQGRQKVRKCDKAFTRTLVAVDQQQYLLLFVYFIKKMFLSY